MSHSVFRQLVELHQNGHLDEAITTEMLPNLAQAIRPHLRRYQAKHGTAPDGATIGVITNNYAQDGPLVEALLDYGSSESASLWGDIHLRLMSYTQKNWSYLDPVYQDKMVGATYLRVYRYLPKFLFQSRLDTWIFTILKNEYLRVYKRVKQENKRKIYLEDPIYEDLTWKDHLPARQPDPLNQVAWKQSLQEFWLRIEATEKDPGPKMLRLHLAGYKLHEIQAQLGEDPPDVSTIQRRLRRMIKRMKGDPVITEIAWRLGFVVETK